MKSTKQRVTETTVKDEPEQMYLMWIKSSYWSLHKIISAYDLWVVSAASVANIVPVSLRDTDGTDKNSEHRHLRKHCETSDRYLPRGS